MKSKKILNKILGMTMLLVMLLIPVLNVSASSSAGTIGVKVDGGQLEPLDSEGDYLNGVTLNVNYAGVVEITFDQDINLEQLSAKFDTKININGTHNIDLISRDNIYTIKGNGTVHISELEYTDKTELPYTIAYEKITLEWADEHIVTDLNVYMEDGALVITSEELGGTVEEPEEPTEPETPEYVLSTDDMEFISDEPFDENLTLVKYDVIEEVKDIDDEELTAELEKYIASIIESVGNKTLLGLYEISVLDENYDVVPMENGNFKIRLKLTDEMKKYNLLIAAYIKDGVAEELFEVTVDGDYLEFNTSHLSEYAILGDYINEENPNTGDHIGLYIIIALAGLTGLLISFKSMKNMA